MNAQTTATVHWEFNTGDKVQRIDNGQRGTISHQHAKIRNLDGVTRDCVYEVRLDDHHGAITLCRQANLRRFPVETIAAEYVETAARGAIGDLAELQAVANGGWMGEQFITEMGVERIAAALEITSREVAEAAGVELAEQAEERMQEWPLAVEATTTFEVVLGTGGPDQALCFECASVDHGEDDMRYGRFEIRRVFYRYSWEGSAEVELHGDDRETAEAFGRRVVPELVE